MNMNVLYVAMFGRACFSGKVLPMMRHMIICKTIVLIGSAKIAEDAYMHMIQIAVFSITVNNVELVWTNPPVGDVWNNIIMAACVNRASLLIIIIFTTIAFTAMAILATTREICVLAVLGGDIA